MTTPSLKTAAGSGSRSAKTQVATLDALRAWWAGLQPREQQMLGIGLTVSLFALIWLVAVQPAWQLFKAAPARLAALDAQTVNMQRLAGETKAMRGSPQVTPAQSAAALRDASARLGAGAKLSIQGDRAVLTVEGLSGEDLRSWLAEVRSGARARAVEAQLTRGAAGFSGSLTLSLAKGEAP